MLGGDADRARDATQETAVRFLRQLPGFRGDSQLRTWSLGIAINVVRELRRAGHRDGPLPEEMGIVTDGRRASPAGPDESVEMNERRDILRATLADLPDRQREAVVLRNCRTSCSPGKTRNKTPRPSRRSECCDPVKLAAATSETLGENRGFRRPDPSIGSMDERQRTSNLCLSSGEQLGIGAHHRTHVRS